MSQQQVTTDNIRIFFRSAFEKAGYTKSRICRFLKTSERLHEYMTAFNISHYTPEVGAGFIQMERNSSEFSSNIRKLDSRAIEVLDMILANVPILLRPNAVKVKTYPGEIGEASKAFLKYRETERRSAPGSIERYACVLSPFSIYCEMHGMHLGNINYGSILGYMSARQNADSKSASVLKLFFKYLYESDRLDKDYSQDIVSISPKRREKIPSFYNKDEILKIENSIERTEPKGKRNYAIIKLASRLGLRASDIAALEFSDIDWEKNIIKIRQRKTGKYVTLPLLADVGNALVDYISNGRPKDNRKVVFLSHICPRRVMSSRAVSNIVSTAIVKAGIETKGRRIGAHSLRHSLAYSMLDSGATVGSISGALGHSSVESTMVYMGIDMRMLIECALSVPQVDAAFYNQGGGLLYD